MAKRISPESGTLVEYVYLEANGIDKYTKRFQVYLLHGSTTAKTYGTYRCEQAYDLSSAAFDAARTWIRKGYTAKVYDAVASKWIAIPR
jgi:hypothetical protein